jgi:DASH complex subunit DAD1
MESVLVNLNRLNRAMEPILIIGNEFSSVEALWSTFEGVMGDGVNNTNNRTGGPEKKEDVDASEDAPES